LTKSFGSNNSKNLVKAVIDGLSQLRSKEEIQALRGVELGRSDVEKMVSTRTAAPAVTESVEEEATA